MWIYVVYSQGLETLHNGTPKMYVTFFNPWGEQGSKDAMKGFNYDPPSLLKICDLLCVAIGGLM